MYLRTEIKNSRGQNIHQFLCAKKPVIKTAIITAMAVIKNKALIQTRNFTKSDIIIID